jgi:ABC-type multidrug transport system fused ATPase/permease subunit
VLSGSPILVLDEATGSLGSESESLIQEALGTLVADRTVIVIAHRLSTVQAMDRPVVLADGEMREDGSHTQLLAAGNTYASLWQQQFGAFLGVPE